MNRVADKVAIVTGGAKGIGAASAQLLAQEGAKVVLTDVDEKGGKRIAAEIRKAGGQAHFVHQDVTDEASWPALVRTTVKKFGGLNILVNNAGIAFAGNAEQTEMKDWRRMISINLDSVFLGTKYAIPAMKGKKGSIINISSVEGLVADPKLAAYNASKGGVRIFTKSAALHCAQSGYGIRVNSIHPGYIWTPMVEDFLKELGDEKANLEAITKLHPIGHLGEAIDIAYGVLYLASDESRFVTGSELVIDGGYTAQ